jgi:heme oxygenase
MSLKELTKEKHRDAERCAFSQKLISGNMSIHDYANYLVQMGYVYQILENKAYLLKLTQDLPGIARAYAIQKDIVELVGEDHGIEYLPATIRYGEYLESLSDTKAVMAHLYVRHMGDLFGGQIISKKVPGSGNFYQFKDRDHLIFLVRSMISDDLADEALIAFDCSISIMKELISE